MHVPLVPKELRILTGGDGRGQLTHQTGKTVLTRVLAVDGNRVTLAYGGGVLFARSSGVLNRGDLLTAVVRRLRDGTMVLKLRDRVKAHPVAREFVQSASLEPSDKIVEVVAALIRSGRTLNTRMVRAVARRLRDRDTSEEKVRGAVECEERDIPEEAVPAQALWSPSLDSRQRRRDSEDSSNRSFTADIRDIVTRAEAVPHHPIQLFNHLATHSSLHWVVVPVRAVTATDEASGEVRIGISPVDGCAARVTVTARRRAVEMWVGIDVARRSVEWSYSGDYNSGKSFERSLEVNFRAYDIKRRVAEHDGADVEDSPLYGVDTYG